MDLSNAGFSSFQSLVDDSVCLRLMSCLSLTLWRQVRELDFLNEGIPVAVSSNCISFSTDSSDKMEVPPHT